MSQRRLPCNDLRRRGATAPANRYDQRQVVPGFPLLELQ